uniref:SDR family NAD(P)-dependent oxidoreductase n=1 Tax=Streptomyces sp. SBT349 TaxID=1580539 RepID=UPI001F1CC87F
VSVDWSPLVAGAGATAPVELPTYPFQRRRYWLETTTEDTRSASPRPADENEGRFWEAVEAEDLPSLSSLLDMPAEPALQAVLPAVSTWRRRTRDRHTAGAWLYQAVWEPLAETASASRPAGRWLAVAPPDPEPGRGNAPGPAVLQALTRLGADVHVLTVDPATADRSGIAAALHRALDEAPDISGVLSLLALDERPHPDHFGLTSGVTGTLLLTQAMADLGARLGDARLWCATQGAVTVAAAPADAAPRPEHAQVWGLGQVAAVEHPRLWGGLVDLADLADLPGPAGPERADGDVPPSWLDQRLGAVLAHEGDEDQFALRPGGTYVRRLAPVPSPARGAAPEWRPRETALITGGTGPMETQVAGWLARRGVRRVVLTDPTAGDGTEGHPLVAELAELGVLATVIACDPTDRAQLAGLVKRLGDEGDTIRSVFHTAAAIELTPLTETEPVQLARAVLAKGGVAQHLEELLPEESLDAVVYFTSVAGVWGSGNHAAYAAANAHLDALAQRRRARGQAATSVAWSLWEMPTPEEAADPEVPRAMRAARGNGLPPMNPELALNALQQALERDHTAVAVADIAWERFVPTFTLARPSRLIEGVPAARDILAAAESDEPADAGESEELRSRLASLSVEQQQHELTRLVCTHAGAVLGHAPGDTPEPQRAFRDLGIESMTAIELRNKLNRATGLRLPATLVFEYPTPAMLADHLRTEIVRDGTMSVSALHAELDRMDRGLAQATASEAERAQITQRLEKMLSAWSGAGESASDASENFTDTLESASDDEVFEFLHRELGKPS